ncbi:MAG: RecX family transcriptional regulator [Clostridia bacterium]|nr:RecX family transcriptional regulator [Clostridia bacterium]
MKAKIVGIEKKRGGEWRLSFAIAAPAGVRRMSFRIKEEKCKELDTLEIGEVLDEERYLLFAVEEEKRAALDKAVQILSMGDNSRRGLYRKLKMRGFTEEGATYAVSTLVKKGYLDEEKMLDRQFAVFAAKKTGMLKIASSLSQKGFSSEMIEEARQRARNAGVYDEEEIKMALAQENPDLTRQEWQKLLKKHGFVS